MARQKLIIVCGSPCVGKTTVATMLFQSQVSDDEIEIGLVHKKYFSTGFFQKPVEMGFSRDASLERGLGQRPKSNEIIAYLAFPA